MAEAAFEWHPSKFLLGLESDYALLVLNQPLKNSITLGKLWRNGMF